MQPKLSVLVNSWNGKPYLELFLSSLLKAIRNHKDEVEICVALDGCEDGSKKYVESLDVKWCWNEHHGLSYSINKAAELATGEYFFWASNDYVIPSNFYTNLKKYLQPNNFVSIDTIEPQTWAVQPYADFGDKPNNFRYEEFDEYTIKIRPNLLANRIGYAWGNGIFHSRCWGSGFDTEYDPYGVMDDDFIYSVFKRHPEELFFCPNDVSVYHFGSATIQNKKHIVKNELSSIFQRKFNIPHEKWNKRIEDAMEKKYRSFNFLTDAPRVIGHKRKPGLPQELLHGRYYV